MGPFSRCLTILIYHRVVPVPDPLLPETTSAGEFDWQMAAVRRWFKVLSLTEAVAGLRGGALPRRAACVTFDDGYADNADIALPILERHGIRATFFVATGFLDGGRMWNDTLIETLRLHRADSFDGSPAGLGSLDTSSLEQRRRALSALLDALRYLPHEVRHERVRRLAEAAGGAPPSRLMMSATQVRLLRERGMEVGAHTMTHPILAGLSREAALAEIAGSKARLEEITRAPVTLFAYPNGRPEADYRAEHAGIVRELGFDAAVSTAWGVARAGSDLYQLPRFTPWDRTPGGFAARLLLNTFRVNPQLA